MISIDFIKPQAILTSVKASSKKQLLETLSKAAAAETGLPEREVFDGLLLRERLGSTGTGKGIAIPHGKFEKAAGITGLFARLETPVDFQALDGQPVDLVFLLIAPESAGTDHLRALSRIARLMRSGALASQLRAAPDAHAIHTLLVAPPESQAA